MPENKDNIDRIFNDLERDVRSAAKRAFRASALRKVAITLAKQIKKRTRLGKGVERDGGNPIRLDPLSSKYKVRRKKERLSRQTTPSTSNLTRTGEMLDSLKGKASKGVIIVDFKDSRKDGATNSQVIEWTEDGGRPFFYVAEFEFQIITDDLIDLLEKELNKVDA